MTDELFDIPETLSPRLEQLRESDTPETDAEKFTASFGDWGNGEFVPAECSRRLERQHNELRGRVIKWRDMPASEMRLMAGELTANEIRSIRAILHQIIPSEL